MMTAPVVSRPTLVLAVALAASIAHCAPAGMVQTFTQLELEEPFAQFGFGLAIISIPEIQGDVIESRVEVEFTTEFGFDAADFSMLILAPTENDFGEFGNIWTIVGSDLGWSGQGTFTASISSFALTGLIFPSPMDAVWEVELGPNFGTIESLRVEHDYVIPAPAGLACLLLGGFAARRRRRFHSDEL